MHKNYATQIDKRYYNLNNFNNIQHRAYIFSLHKNIIQ
jgi:hypothetical protein